jgi:hypothetical protein
VARSPLPPVLTCFCRWFGARSDLPVVVPRETVRAAYALPGVSGANSMGIRNVERKTPRVRSASRSGGYRREPRSYRLMPT